MSRLSLYDRNGNKTERKLPICKMCNHLFASDEAGGSAVDCRIAAFRPCGHVFHYSCIMKRYEKQEDNCSCPTCYARFEDLPVVLFMEWSKSVRPLSREETENIRHVGAPDEHAIDLRGNLAVLNLKLDGLRERKRKIIEELNEINDASAMARAKCDGLDELCDILAERVSSARTVIKREDKLCDEIRSRIERDRNKALAIELGSMVERQEPDAKLSEFILKHLSDSSDPDGLLSNLNTLYSHYHRKVKESSQTLSQLKTSVNSVRKDVDHADQRLIALQRAKQAKNTVKRDVKASSTYDRKTVTTKSRLVVASHDHDELGLVSKRSRSNNYNFFT